MGYSTTQTVECEAKGNGKKNNMNELENSYSNTKITSALTRYS